MRNDTARPGDCERRPVKRASVIEEDFNPGSGLACPRCGVSQSRVRDTRPSLDMIRRRRVCDGCSARYTTFELATDDGEAEGFYEALKLSGELASLTPGMRKYLRGAIRQAAIEQGRREALQSEREEP